MDQAQHDADYRKLCEILRLAREVSGLRQIDIAKRLGVHQSFVSKYETAERRLDVIELRDVCAAIGIPLMRVLSDLG